MQTRLLNEYQTPDSKKWRWQSIQGYGVYQILDCIDCLLVFFSSVISPLLSCSWFSQDKTIGQSTSAWLSANTLHHPSCYQHLCLFHLWLCVWTVLKRFILLKYIFWIEMSVSEQLPDILMSRYEGYFWNRHSHLKEPWDRFMSQVMKSDVRDHLDRLERSYAWDISSQRIGVTF